MSLYTLRNARTVTFEAIAVDNKQLFSDAIYFFLGHFNGSANDLAKKFGVSPTTIHDWSNDHRQHTYPNIVLRNKILKYILLNEATEIAAMTSHFIDIDALDRANKLCGIIVERANNVD